MSDFKTLLVPYDFSEHARVALAAAADLAQRLSSDLHLVNVVQTPIYAGAYGAAVPPYIDMNELENAAGNALREAADALQLSGSVTTHVVQSGQVSVAICDLAEELGVDLIVMGTHGRTGLAHVFLGSVAERTLRGAPCPVLTVQDRSASE